jgi:hypothetical protein
MATSSLPRCAMRMLPLVVAASTASAAPDDFLMRHGFEQCHAGAISRATARQLLATEPGGQIACIPPQTVPFAGGSILLCQQSQCPGAEPGCPAVIESEATGDAYPPGSAEFTIHGTMAPLAVPVTVATLIGNTNCTLTVSDLAFDAVLGFAVGIDHGDGVYARVRNRSDLDLVDYSLAGCDSLMATLQLMLPFLEAQLESSAAEAVGSSAEVLLGESICPISDPD